MNKLLLWLLVVIALALGMVVLPGALCAPATAAPPALPIRPTLAPQPGPEVQAASGAFILLRVEFGPTWAESGLAWQDLYTVVQWQENSGIRHDVVGWQGNLDEASKGTGKTWWLSPDLFGRGPIQAPASPRG